MQNSAACCSDASKEVAKSDYVSILDGLQVDGSYEDPDGGTLSSVTVKLLNDSFRRTTRDGRPIIHGVALTNIRLVGMITSFVEEEQTVHVTVDDGTGISEWIFWKTSSTNGLHSNNRFPCYAEIIGAPRLRDKEISLTAYNIRKITNFNSVTNHFLEVIAVALERWEKYDPRLDHLFFSKNNMRIEKDDIILKDVYNCIQELSVRDIPCGVSCCSIEENVDASAECIRAFVFMSSKSHCNPTMGDDACTEQEANTEHGVIASDALIHNGENQYDKTDLDSFMDEIDWNSQLLNLPSQPLCLSPENLFNGLENFDVISNMVAPSPEYNFHEILDDGVLDTKENEENISMQMPEYLEYSTDPEIIFPPASYDAGVCGFFYAPEDPPKLDQLTDKLRSFGKKNRYTAFLRCQENNYRESSDKDQVCTPDGFGANVACFAESSTTFVDLDPVDPEYSVPARNTRPRLQ
ncbi:hypothetical protein ACP70R_017624 [Stipagrostis hirtigluma subsp. patula]